MTLNVMGVRNTKSKLQAAEESDDPLTWIGLIVAALLALALAIESAPAVRGMAGGAPTEATAD